MCVVSKVYFCRENDFFFLWWSSQRNEKTDRGQGKEAGPPQWLVRELQTVVVISFAAQTSAKAVNSKCASVRAWARVLSVFLIVSVVIFLHENVS